MREHLRISFAPTWTQIEIFMFSPFSPLNPCHVFTYSLNFTDEWKRTGGLELVSPILAPSPAERWVNELQKIFSVRYPKPAPISILIPYSPYTHACNQYVSLGGDPPALHHHYHRQRERFSCYFSFLEGGKRKGQEETWSTNFTTRTPTPLLTS